LGFFVGRVLLLAALAASAAKSRISAQPENGEFWDNWEKAAFSARLAESIQHQEL